MATTQGVMVKSGSRKRDAETAFGLGGTPDTTHDEEGSQISVAHTNASILVDGLLKTSKKNTRKIVHGLLDDLQKIFGDAETRMEALQRNYEEELAERQGDLKEGVHQDWIFDSTDSTDLAEIENQVVLLENLGLCYKQEKQDSLAKSEFDIHIKRRLHHKNKVSQKGAQVAQVHMQQASQDLKLRADTRKFAKAHRDFFKAIQSVTIT